MREIVGKRITENFSSYIGKRAELAVTDSGPIDLTIHDGTTPGGIALALGDLSNISDEDFAQKALEAGLVDVMVANHSLLSNLTADDHPQYLNLSRGDDRYYTKTLLDAGQLDTRYYNKSQIGTFLDGKADSVHIHTISNVTGLQTALDSKSGTGHTHIISDVTGLQLALDNKSNTGHTHLALDITDFSSAVDTRISLQRGAANGVAALDSGGRVPLSQLPSYVDDVLEYDELADFPGTGETGKIYIALDTNKQYRWSGSIYVELAAGVISSVFGRTGVIVAANGDYNTNQVTEGTNLYYTVSRARTAAVVNSLAGTQTDQAPSVVSVNTALATKSGTGHTHIISDVTGLQSELDDKADFVHTHIISDVTGLQLALDSKASSSHTHIISDVTGLQTALDGKSGTGHTHTASQITDFSTAADARISAQKGANNGLATLDSGGKVPTDQLPSAILGSLSYQGTWNASTNSPTLASGTGSKGYYYVVTSAGTTNLDGETSWNIKDWATYNGSTWQKIDNTDTVVSVNGATGAVVLTTNEINDSSNKRYVTDSQLVVLGNTSGTNTGDQTNIPGNAATATTLQTARTISISGDLTYTSPAFNGGSNITGTGTLATVNSNVGTFTNATVVVNAKGLVTAVSNGTGGGSGESLVYDVNQSSHGFSVGQQVYFNGTSYALAQANTDTSAEVIGTVSSIEDTDNFRITMSGLISGLSGLTPGEVYFLSSASAGTYTTTAPTGTNINKPVLYALSSSEAIVLTYRGIGGGDGSNISASTIANGSVSDTEFQYLDGVTSSIQTQLNSKQATLTTGSTAQYFRGDLSLATFPTALSSFTNDTNFITAAGAPVLSVNGSTGAVVLTTANIADGTNKRYVTDAHLVVLGNTSGTNTGDQTSIVGISGSKAQFDTAVTDGNFLYVGDITQYTDEMAQDAVAGIFTDSSEIDFTYDDGSNTLTASLKTGIDVSKFANGSVSNTEFQYLDGVTSGIQSQLNAKQATLVSGTNIKTINGTNVLGTGDIVIAGGGGDGAYLETSFTAQTSVTVTHGFNSRPIVSVLDDTNEVIIPLSVTHTSANEFTVTFGISTTGKIISMASGGIGIADGSKGDITVSGSGGTWTVNTGLSAAKIANGSVSDTEFQYLDGVTSGIQSQLNSKQATLTTGSTAQYFRGDLSLATFPTALSSFTNDTNYITAAGAPVLSVNGSTGAITLSTSNITEGTNLYFTDGRARTAAVLNTLAGSETNQAPSVASVNTALAGKSGTGHTHTASDITDFSTAADARITVQKGANNGLATLDGGGKVPTAQLPSSVIGGLSYQGTWNASTNSPSLTSGTGTKGYYYVVTVAGTTSIDSENDWKVKDWATYNGTAWEKVDNTETVTSVNSATGAVVLTTANIADGTNKRYVTDAHLVVLGNTSGTNTGDQTNISGNAATATVLQTGRTISISGDLTYTSPSFNGGGDVTATGTLATVNSNVGTFGSGANSVTVTVNGKGLITAISNTAISISSSAVTDFNEAAQDAIGSIVDASLVYNDTGGVLSRAAITGDISIAAGSNVATLATVNSNVGTYSNATVVVNAKGLITSVSNGTGGGISDGTYGEITVTGSGGTWSINNNVNADKIANGSVSNTEFQYLDGVTSSIQTQINSKQATLVSGTNIKTINGTNILGTGNLVISGGTGGGSQEVFIQETEPVPAGPALWIQTGLGVGGEDFMLWAMS